MIYAIMLAAFEEYRHIEVPSSALNEKLSSLEEALRSGSESALLYYQDKEAVASCRFKFDEHSLYFSRLAVLPEMRGRGIARAILLWLANHAMDHGRTEMGCRVRMAIPRNIDLYKSVGFIATKEEVVTNPNGLAVKTLVMRQPL